MSALVQSNLGGHASISAGAASCTGHFSSNTTAGSFLVGVCSYDTTAGGNPFIPTLSTPGTSWTSAKGSNNPNGLGWQGGLTIFVCPNAPSISSGTNTTYHATFGGSPVGAIEFVLLEFSGCSASAGIGGIDASSSNTGSSGTTPNPGNLTTTQTDLIVSAYVGSDSAISAGSGFMLGPALSTVAFGGSQYALNVASGTVATAFSGTEARWAAASIAVLPGAAASTGYTFGTIIGA